MAMAIQEVRAFQTLMERVARLEASAGLEGADVRPKTLAEHTSLTEVKNEVTMVRADMEALELKLNKLEGMINSIQGSLSNLKGQIKGK